MAYETKVIVLLRLTKPSQAKDSFEPLLRLCPGVGGNSGGLVEALYTPHNILKLMPLSLTLRFPPGGTDQLPDAYKRGIRLVFALL